MFLFFSTPPFEKRMLPFLVTSAIMLLEMFFSTLNIYDKNKSICSNPNPIKVFNIMKYYYSYPPRLQGSCSPLENMMLLPNLFNTVSILYKHITNNLILLKLIQWTRRNETRHNTKLTFPPNSVVIQCGRGLTPYLLMHCSSNAS